LSRSKPHPRSGHLRERPTSHIYAVAEVNLPLRPEQLPKGEVLVASSGNPGSQIADELLRIGRHVFPAISRHVRVKI
jgi:hypothetical protein